MSSIEESIGKFVNEAVGSVEGFVNKTADNVAGFLKGNNNIGLNKQSSGRANSMGSTSSKTSHSSSTTSHSLIPPFSVAYGLNSSGKTVLYHIDIARDFPGREETRLTVGDLQQHLAALTSLPIEHQTIIHKGTHLQSDINLSSLKIRHGTKMMMLGRVPPDPDEKYRKTLSALEDEVSVTSMQVMELQIQLDSDGQAAMENKKFLRKNFLLANENFMKILMKIDAVEIPSDRVEPRASRKALVVRVHKEMEAVDKLVAKCSAETEGDASSTQQVVFQDSR